MISYRDLPPVVIPVGDRERLQAIARSLADQSHPLAAPLLQELTAPNCAIPRPSRRTHGERASPASQRRWRR